MATVCRDGDFLSPKNGPVDFNKELADLFVDFIAPEWLKFFDFYLRNIENVTKKVRDACIICHKAMSQVLHLDTELPSFIDPQLESLFDGTKFFSLSSQAQIYQMIIPTVQCGMLSAYNRGKVLKKTGTGIYKKWKYIIEKHVYEDKLNMFEKVNSMIKRNLLIVREKIKNNFKEGHDQLIEDLTGMYEPHFKEANNAGADHSQCLRDLLGPIQELSALDEHNGDAASKLLATVQQLLSGDLLPSDVTFPDCKRRKIDE